MANLLTLPTFVESPFIIVKIGDYTFGSYTKLEQRKYNQTSIIVDYPNYMDSITIQKVNGDVNTYIIRMLYGITQGDDPNLFEKVFGSVSDTRKITISYGDWNSPSFIYKEESAIIVNIQSQVDFASSRISYTIKCVSDALNLTASKFNFPARIDKPSDVIRELLVDKQYGVQGIFYGMLDPKKVTDENLIATDDQTVRIEAKPNMSILDYMNYLVSCMIPMDSQHVGKTKEANQFTDTYLSNAIYKLAIFDDIRNNLGGPYFKVVKVQQNQKQYNSFDTFEVDVGFPTSTLVTNFSLKNDQEWGILYKFADQLQPQNYIYSINNLGEISYEYSPNLTISSKYLKTTPSNRQWWSQMTQFPIQATLTIKGLVRPVILMQYVKVNALFYGNRHASSGLYIVTKQEDTVNSSGYRTTLQLLRIGQDYFDDMNYGSTLDKNIGGGAKI